MIDEAKVIRTAMFWYAKFNELKYEDLVPGMVVNEHCEQHWEYGGKLIIDRFQIMIFSWGCDNTIELVVAETIDGEMDILENGQYNLDTLHKAIKCGIKCVEGVRIC